jgi:hypothetical protein
MKKHIITSLISLVLVFFLIPASLSMSMVQTSVNVSINNTPVEWTDVIPFIDNNNRTMVPLRAVGEALGLSVYWDNNSREAVFSNGSDTIYFPIDSTFYRTKDGVISVMDTAAVIVDNRTFAPVRYLADYFGYIVDWNPDTNTVEITGDALPY